MHIRREKPALIHADRGTCACTLTEADTGRHPYTETCKRREKLACTHTEGDTWTHAQAQMEMLTHTEGQMCAYRETLRFIQT